MIETEIQIFIKEHGILNIEDESLRPEIVSESVNIILKRFVAIAKMFSVFRKDAIWYLTGKTKKEAMEKIIISGGDLNENANAMMSRELMGGFPVVVKSSWNDYDDDILCQNYIQSDICNFSYSLVLSFENETQALVVVSEMIMNIIADISPIIVTVETNNYSLNQNHVFPERLPVGWMFYTNKIYDENLAGLQKKTHAVTKGGEPIGTLFFSKQGFFDGSNKEDIKMANDLEMMLASYEILPTYRNIF